MQSFTFAMMLTMSTMAAPTLSTDISAFPWEVVSPATKDTYTTGNGALIDNVWAVAGSGEELRKTSIILHYDGKVWTKHLENAYIGADAVFARGNDVWVGHQNGQIIHSNDGFKTHMIIQKGYRGDFSIGQIRGGSSATSPIYIAGPDGLKVIKNPTCVPKKQFGFFGPLVPCQKVEHLAQVPDKGNSGYVMMALIGELPGMTEDQVYTAGYADYGTANN
ncbi:hypothetical protein BC833DRAFT_564050 [Globomyces pollinis-pini]|nr:hypothetical protein BC833DRAFT_564050 [Globomyces pollinis-pini]